MPQSQFSIFLVPQTPYDDYCTLGVGDILRRATGLAMDVEWLNNPSPMRETVEILNYGLIGL